MSVLMELQDKVKSAMKSGDREQVTALRLVVCELQRAAKEVRHELDQASEHQVLRRELRKRQEAADAFRAGGRSDLVNREEYQARLIEEMLPQQLDEAALRVLIDGVVAETGAGSVKEMGKVMAAVMARGGAQVDGKLASRLVRERLSA